MTRRPLLAAALSALVLLLGGCAVVPGHPPEAAPAARACPDTVPADARCWFGQDSAGAHYVIVQPAQWSGVLVLHAHGGPTLGPVKAERALEDLKRWSIWVRSGHAFAASTFRQGGVEVRAAAEDTERLRRIVHQHVMQPRRTVLHGQSWGASVAAKGAEMFTRGTDGRPPYDAVLLSSGVLGGGTRSYDFRLDLRVVYQHLCNNHPRPDEPAYPLWMGLPAGSTLKADDLRLRTRECLGLGLPAAQRTPEQVRRLKTLVDVIRIPESSVQGHLNWATFHFADIAHQRSGGRPVFGNIGAVYSGSADDRTLNAAVARYAADAQAVARFAADTDPTGRIPVPVLTVHAIHDAVAFVELEHEFQRTMTAAGRADALVQTYTDDREHSYLSDPVYPTLIEALLRWADGGPKPTPQAIADRCQALQTTYGAGCRFRPDFQPPPLASRVVPRQRP
jgi:alpha-beta hydrolase superfamily lysophospholipase